MSCKDENVMDIIIQTSNLWLCGEYSLQVDTGIDSRPESVSIRCKHVETISFYS